MTTSLIATYTYDGESMEFSFADYAEFQTFKLHDELIEAGFELEFETVLTIDKTEDYEQMIWLAEYKDVDA